MELKNIKELIAIFENSNLGFLEVDIDNSHIKMKKSKDYSHIEQVPIEATLHKTSQIVNNYTSLKSPVVGVFYTCPSPEELPFVKIGDKVSKGDVVGLIEAMKVISEIKAPTNGVIQEILVSNEQLVSFGDVLMQIEE